jgi:predicted outer membrane repeat protein
MGGRRTTYTPLLAAIASVVALAGSGPAEAAECSVAAGDSSGFKDALNNSGCTVINLGDGSFLSSTGFVIDHTVRINGWPHTWLYRPGSDTQALETEVPVVSITGGAPRLNGVGVVGGGPGFSVSSNGGTPESPITISHAFISQGWAGNGGSGGGISYSGSGFLRVESSWLRDNQAKSGGGFLDAGNGSLELNGVAFSGNTAYHGDGGAFSQPSGMGTTRFENVTFNANSAVVRGGAISSNSAGATTLNNVTIAGNGAGAGPGYQGSGGGLSITGAGPDQQLDSGQQPRLTKPTDRRRGLRWDDAGDSAGLRADSSSLHGWLCP